MNNKDKIILHLCCDEDIASDSEFYRNAGYDVRLIGKSIGVENYTPHEKIYGIIANPPCTMFSFARTNAKQPRDLQEGMRCVHHCLRIIWHCLYFTPGLTKDTQKYSPLKFWILENPDAMLRWFLGKPAMIYNPYDFGDQYQKRTAIWGHFNEPKKNPVILNAKLKELHKSNSQPLPKFDYMKSKDIAPEYYEKFDRRRRRSICSPGFAKAFYEANQ